MTEKPEPESFAEMLERLCNQYGFDGNYRDARMMPSVLNSLLTDVTLEEGDALLAAYVAHRERLAVEAYKKTINQGA